MKLYQWKEDEPSDFASYLAKLQLLGGKLSMILVFFVISVWHLYRISRIINLKRIGIIAIIACVHVTMVARTAIAAPTVICNKCLLQGYKIRWTKTKLKEINYVSWNKTFQQFLRKFAHPPLYIFISGSCFHSSIESSSHLLGFTLLYFRNALINSSYLGLEKTTPIVTGVWKTRIARIVENSEQRIVPNSRE